MSPRGDGMAVETYCDCMHRKSVHWALALRDPHGETVVWAGAAKCGIAGCACVAFTQEGQRRLLADVERTGDAA